MSYESDERVVGEPDVQGNGQPEGNSISPLPGEPGIPDVAARRRFSVSWKGLLTLVFFAVALIGVLAYTIHRFSLGGPVDNEKLNRDKPTAASLEPRKLDLPTPRAPNVPASAAPRIPALVATADDVAEPIGVRRTGTGAPVSGGPKVAPPEDAPVLLVTTKPGAPPSRGAPFRATTAGPTNEGAAPTDPSDAMDPMRATSRNLQAYQQQLQGLLDNLTKTATTVTGQGTAASLGPMPSGALVGGSTVGGPVGTGGTPAGGGLFGGQLQGSSTPKVLAGQLGNRSLTLPKGAAFTCALKTKVISATSGLVGCQVQRNVFSDDGRVLLVERGSHMDGEYRIASVRPGTVRIPVLWTRIRTPHGVTVDIDSPGTGPLGESGIEGYVDNRWMERIGAALLLSVIDDSVKLVIQNQSNESSGHGDTIVLPSTTSNASKLSEKVLDSTINIPPLIYQNQGGIVGIYVARDVDFSSVYELKPTAARAASGAKP